MDPEERELATFIADCSADLSVLKAGRGYSLHGRRKLFVKKSTLRTHEYTKVQSSCNNDLNIENSRRSFKLSQKCRPHEKKPLLRNNETTS